MRRAVAAAACGPYEIVAPAADTLFEHEDGLIELIAECSYVVRFEGDARRDILEGALSVPSGGGEGRLRFQNFVGLSSLGSRRLSVRSRRLDAEAVAGMLDDVGRQLASLPFYVDTPTRSGYVRVQDPGPEVLYHSFAFLRDCMRFGRPHDLVGALQRILANPVLTLHRKAPAKVALGAASRIDADTIRALQSEPGALEPVGGGSTAASHPLARSLGGALPTHVRTSSLRQSTDNPVNRFVVGVLLTMIELLRRFERLTLTEKRVSSAVNAREARELAEALERVRRHPILDDLSPLHEAPLSSTALRGRAGYRELLTISSELLAHASRAEPHDAQALLELRETATIYEYWCFFQVVEELRSRLGDPVKRARFAAATTHSKVPWGYSFRWEEVDVAYNRTFKRSPSAEEWPGATSYGRAMRPDIAVTAPSGLHVLDAKLRINLGDREGDDFKSDDLHKMHAYRDALGASSAWVLYPGSGSEMRKFRMPAAGGAFEGVGAVPLKPNGSATMAALVGELLG